MKLPTLTTATFVERPNRFVAIVRRGGAQERVHVANPGRCAELLVPGCQVWLEPAPAGSVRKTAWTVALVQHEGALVSMRSHLANDLVAEALHAGRIAGLERMTLQREVTHGASRFDFRLNAEGQPPVWLEVKSVTLVEVAGGDRVARFPDAPTARGARHVQHLAEIVSSGEGRAMLIFVVQRPDAVRVEPHTVNDPAFSQALCQAVEAGVVARAFGCQVSEREIVLTGELPVVLPLGSG